MVVRKPAIVVHKHNKPEPVTKVKAHSKGGLLTVYISLWEHDPERKRFGRVWAYLPVDDPKAPPAQREKVTFALVSEAREWAKEYGYNGIRCEHAKWEVEAKRRASRTKG